jgi:hypothetical protein
LEAPTSEDALILGRAGSIEIGTVGPDWHASGWGPRLACRTREFHDVPWSRRRKSVPFRDRQTPIDPHPGAGQQDAKNACAYVTHGREGPVHSVLAGAWRVRARSRTVLGLDFLPCTSGRMDVGALCVSVYHVNASIIHVFVGLKITYRYGSGIFSYPLRTDVPIKILTSKASIML